MKIRDKTLVSFWKKNPQLQLCKLKHFEELCGLLCTDVIKKIEFVFGHDQKKLTHREDDDEDDEMF